MKKYVLICCLTFGAMSFFSSCSLYYYDRGYGYQKNNSSYFKTECIKCILTLKLLPKK